MVQEVNDNLILLCGKSAGGKSASLHSIKDPEGVLYLNCEAGKKLPFRSKFKQVVVTDPYIIPQLFEQVESEDKCHSIVVDSLTFLMDMYESMYVLNSTNTMAAWSQFAQYFKNLMQNQVAKSTKNVIFTAHIQSTLNEDDMVLETKVPIKGALKNNGIEAYFSTIVTARSMPIEALKDYSNSLLTITPKEERIGIKYVYQTQLTKETVNERIRSAIGIWDDSENNDETFIDNNAQFLLDRLHQYYD